MKKEINRDLFVKEGAKGGKQKGINYKKYLIDELSKVCEKGELNFYMELAKNPKSTPALQEALLIKRGKNEQ